jgi:hypothetical protein
MKKLIWDLMDEVYDASDYLLVKNNHQEDKLYLVDIMNISSSMNMNPARITLKLRKPCKFGDEVSFTPRIGLRLSLLSIRKIADDLIQRVDNARRKK